MCVSLGLRVRRGLFPAAVCLLLRLCAVSSGSPVRINEFLAGNDTGLKDGNGDYSDWIELYNESATNVWLTGWYLTDDAQDLTRWSFPATNLAAGKYLVVFASGKNRRQAGRELHTDFKLAGGGEYLGLVQPDGWTVVHEYAPAYPDQKDDISYGVSGDSSNVVLLAVSSPCRVLVPADGSLGTNWLGRTFGDVTWSSGFTGVGYERETGYGSLIGADVEGLMYGRNPTAYIRVPFEAGSLDGIRGLTLRLKYEDGFVAWINGREVARANAPATPAWNSAATASRQDSLAVKYQDFVIVNTAGLLVPGVNVLAVQGLNDAVSSPDFLVLPELQASVTATNTPRTTVYFATPTPGAANVDHFLGSVEEVEFSARRGMYTQPVQVTLSTDTGGAQIRYTLDGSWPTDVGGVVYSAPFTFTNTTVLRAAAFKPGYRAAATRTHTYLFFANTLTQPPNPGGFPAMWGGTAADYAMDPRIVTNGAYRGRMTNSLRSLATLCLAAKVDDLFDGTHGIYANPTQSGAAWERAASAEWMEAEDGAGFELNLGLRIFGGYFRNMGATRKKTLRMLFKGAYGPTSLDYDLFAGQERAAKVFDTVVCRAGANDGYNNWGNTYVQYIIDEFGRRSQRAMGQASPHGRFAHIYVNGLYWGLYNPIERPDGSFGATYFGGNKDTWDAFSTGEVVDGNATAWNQLLSACRAGLADNAAYQRVQGNNPDRTRNPSYPVQIDVENYVDYMLLNLWMGNSDWPHNNWRCGRDRSAASTGFKFFMWDSELSMLSPWSSLNTDRTGVTAGVAEPYSALRQNAEFRLLFADRVHRHLFNGGALTPESALARYTELANGVEEAVIAETARWGDQYGGAPRTLDTWRTARNNMLNNYLPQRPAVVLQQFRNAGLYPAVGAPSFTPRSGAVPGGTALTMAAGAGAEIYFTLDGSDPRSYGTGAAAGTLYTNAVPLRWSATVKARARSGGVWSALNEAVFVVDETSPLRVTEVMYHPRRPEGVETNGGLTASDYEFVEVWNAGTQTVGLAGMRFTDGVVFDFTRGAVASLAPGKHVVVVKNLTAFRRRYPGWTNGYVAGEFQMNEDFTVPNLSDGGERIELADGLGRTVAAFEYGDGRGWPMPADGGGHSLVPLALDAQNGGALDYGGNWRASAYRDGSPGATDPAPVRDVVINEIVAHTDVDAPPYDSNDAIELFNVTGRNLTLTNWYLSDSLDDLRKWLIPSPTTIVARGWLWFDEMTGFHNPITSGFGLNKQGEALFLSSLVGGAQDRIADWVRFKAQENGVSLARYPDGDAAWFAMRPTTNGANEAPGAHLILSEIMYRPRPLPGSGENNTRDEYVELHNPGADWACLWTPAGTYRLDGGVDYRFPAGVTIPPGGYLAVVSFDPSDAAERGAFLEAYGQRPGEITLLGPYDGQLSNEGERLALERPQASDDPADPDDVSWVLVDEAIYYDQAPWPPEADGTGRPLQRRPAWGDGNDPRQWTAGLSPTPGLAAAPVGIMEPADGAGFALPFSARVVAAIDPDRVSGTVQRVEFYVGTNRFGSDAAAPYEQTLSGLTSTGTHWLSAVLVDESGMRTSRPVRIAVNRLSVENAGAENIGSTSARLCGVLTDGDGADAYVYWGRTDGRTDPASWDHVSAAGSVFEGGFGVEVTGLSQSRTYYFRCFVSSSRGQNWAPSSASFTTLSSRFANWDYRMPVVFSGYARTEALTNFPALVILNPGLAGFSYGQFAAQASGNDLRLSDDSDAELNYEIERWNTNGDSVIWVQIPRLAGTNTTVWAHWGNAAAAAAPPAYATNGAAWSAGFAGVWHLGAARPDGTLPDSSGNGRHGVNTGSTEDPAGRVGLGRALDGSDDKVRAGAVGIAAGQARTIGAWVRSDRTTQTAWTGVFGFQGNAESNDRYFDVQTDSANNYCLHVFGADYDLRALDTQWRFLAATYESGNIRLYVDGAETGFPIARTLATDDKFVLGEREWNGNNFDGSLDEARVARVRRTAAWLWAEWATVASNGAFGVRGPVESGVAVESLPAADLRAGAARLRGRITSTGAAELPTVYVCWGLTDGGVGETGAWERVECLGANWGKGEEFGQVVTGLAQNAWYSYRCRATNSSGRAWSTVAQRFMALGAPAVSNCPASAVTTNRAVLRGELTAGGRAGAVIYWGLAPGGADPSEWSNAVAVGAVSPGAFSAAAAVRAGGHYHFRCFASNELGQGWADSAADFLTPLADVRLSVRGSPFLESGGAATGTVRLSAVSASNVTVRLGFSGTATAGADYTVFPTTVVIQAGETAGTFVLSGRDDLWLESAETIRIQVDGVWNARTGAASTVEAAILSDDVEVTNGEGASSVGQTSARLNGVLSRGHSADAFIFWGPADGGTVKTHWAESCAVGRIGEGLFSVDIGGLLANRTHYYRCFATNAAGADWADATASLRTAGPDLAIRDVTVREGNAGTTNAAFTVTLSAAGAADVSVEFTTLDGTATAGSDYVATNGVLTIPAGATCGVVRVQVRSETRDEWPSEQFRLKVRNAVNAAIVDEEAVCTVLDEDLDMRPWTYRMKITFAGYDPAGVRGVLTNFPALVSFEAGLTNFHAGFAGPHGYELRFANADESELLNYQVDGWSQRTNSGAWVQVPRLAGTNTAIWAYWGNAAATGAPAACVTDGSTWSEGYLAVWHLGEPSGPHADSTANRFDSIETVASVQGLATGIVDGADLFQGVGQRVRTPWLALNRNTFTVSAWVNGRQNADWAGIVFDYDGRVGLRSEAGKLTYAWNGDVARSGLDIPVDRWAYVAGVTHGNGWRARVNGRDFAEARSRTSEALAHGLGIGVDPNWDPANRRWLGVVDEVRLSAVARGVDWLWAEWMTAASNRVFTAYGTAELTGDVNWPRIVALAAGDVTATSATLSGNLLSTGTSATAALLYWGETDGGTNAWAWSHTNELGAALDPGLHRAVLTNLPADRTHFFRFRATNAAGEVWTAPSGRFKTVGLTQVDNGAGVTGIGAGVATLNGRLTYENGVVWTLWGPEDAGTEFGRWARAAPFGFRNQGSAVRTNLTGLLYGRRYYYRTCGSNVAGVSWAPVESFLTATMRIEPAAGLRVRTYDNEYGDSYLDPVANLFNAAHEGTAVQMAAINYGSFTVFPGITSDESLAMLWHGVFRAESATYTFGTASDDGSVLYLDRNGDGDFADAGELIVNNKGSHGRTERTGEASLSAGEYGIAIAMYEGSGGQVMEAKWKKGSGLAYAGQDFVNGTSGAFFQDFTYAPRLGVTNAGARPIGADAAALNATVWATGTYYDVYAFWGAADGGTNRGNWAVSAYVGACADVGRTNVSFAATGLSPGMGYVYTFLVSNALGAAWARPSSGFIMGPVRVEASPGDASEEWPTRGTFTVWRAASATGVAVTVNYVLGGTAGNGVDYAGLSGAVTIPAGSDRAAVEVTPVVDAVVESPAEFVLLSLAPGPYTMGAPSEAAITIRDRTSGVFNDVANAAWNQAGTWTPSGGPPAAGQKGIVDSHRVNVTAADALSGATAELRPGGILETYSVANAFRGGTLLMRGGAAELRGANGNYDYGGAVTVDGAGAVRVNTADTSGNTWYLGSLGLGAGGRLTLETRNNKSVRFSGTVTTPAPGMAILEILAGTAGPAVWLDGAVSGGGTLAKTGANTLYLCADSAVTWYGGGGMVVSQATVVAAAANALGSTSGNRVMGGAELSAEASGAFGAAAIAVDVGGTVRNRTYGDQDNCFGSAVITLDGSLAATNNAPLLFLYLDNESRGFGGAIVVNGIGRLETTQRSGNNDNETARLDSVQLGAGDMVIVSNRNVYKAMNLGTLNFCGAGSASPARLWVRGTYRHAETTGILAAPGDTLWKRGPLLFQVVGNNVQDGSGNMPGNPAYEGARNRGTLVCEEGELRAAAAYALGGGTNVADGGYVTTYAAGAWTNAVIVALEGSTVRTKPEGDTDGLLRGGTIVLSSAPADPANAAALWVYLDNANPGRNYGGDVVVNGMGRIKTLQRSGNNDQRRITVGTATLTAGASLYLDVNQYKALRLEALDWRGSGGSAGLDVGGTDRHAEVGALWGDAGDTLVKTGGRNLYVYANNAATQHGAILVRAGELWGCAAFAFGTNVTVTALDGGVVDVRRAFGASNALLVAGYDAAAGTIRGRRYASDPIAGSVTVDADLFSGAEVQLKGGRFQYLNYSESRVQRGRFRVFSGSSVFDHYDDANDDSQTTTFGAIETAQAGGAVDFQRSTRAGNQSNLFADRSSFGHGVTFTVGGNSPTTLNGVEFYPDATLTKGGAGTLTVQGDLRMRLRGGAELIAARALTLVDRTAGTLTKSTTSDETADGLWSYTANGSAAQIVATLGNRKGAIGAWSGAAAFLPENAGHVAVTGLQAGVAYTFSVDLANVTNHNIAFVVARLANNPAFLNVRAADADTVYFEAVAGAGVTNHLAWDNALSVNRLGADVTGASVPFIVNEDPTNIAPTSAWLNGELVTTGGHSTAVFVHWGDNNGGSDPLSWDDSWSWPVGQAPGHFTHWAQNLAPDKTWFYCYSATNALGRFWAAPVKVFLTGQVTIEEADRWAHERPAVKPATLRVRRPGTATAGDLAVNVAFGGTAVNGTDYTALPGVVAIPDGSATANITMTPVQDANNETSETAIVTVQSGLYAIGAANSATAVIADAAIAVTNLPVTEIAGNDVTLPGRLVSAGGGPNPQVYIYWGTNDAGPTLTVGPGGWQNRESLGASWGHGQTFSGGVQVSDQKLYYYRAYATNASGADWADAASVFVRGEVRIAATDHAAEPADAGAFTVYRPALASAGNLTVYYAADGGTATPGSDYGTLSGSVTIPAGASNANFTVSVLDDFLYGEGTETVKVRLLPGAYVLHPTATSATVNVADDEGSPHDWHTRMKIVFSGYSRPTALTNFPALVVLSAAIPNFDYGQFQSAPWHDLRFADEAETVGFPYEVETWNDAAGKSWVWVRVPALTNGASLWAYWGKAGAARPTYTTNGAVWANGYAGVWHMNHDPALATRDSSTNRWSTTGSGGMNSGNLLAAPAGNGLWFDGIDDYLDVPAIAYGNEPITFTCWTRVNTGEVQNNTTFGNQSGNRVSARTPHGDGRLYWDYGNSTEGQGRITKAGYPLDRWVHVALVGAGGRHEIFWDGAWQAANASAYVGPRQTGLRMGSAVSGSGPWKGRMDEFRVARVARSPDWIWAEWYNMASNGLFCSYDEVEDGVYVVNLAATNVTATGAFLRGQLREKGLAADDPKVFVLWDTQDRGRTSTGLWAHAEYVGQLAVGQSFHKEVTTLAAGNTYFYRCYATNSAGVDWANSAESVFAGTIWLEPAFTNASEAPLAGTVKVCRASSAMNGAVTVRYTVSGTATAGTDYELPSGTVTIPDGASNTWIVVTPIRDFFFEEPPEQVRIALAAGGYVMGSPATVTVHIAEFATNYNDIANGNWNSRATWLTSGAADQYPKGNDTAVMDGNDVTVTAAEQVKNFTWSGNTLTINSGQSLTVRGTGSFTAGANRTLTGGGTLCVGSGAVFRHNSGSEIYTGYWSPAHIEVANGGRFVFKVNGGDVNYDSPWSQFRVLPGGVLEADLPNTTDYVSIYDWDDQRGQFRLLGGTVRGTKGRLYLGTMERTDGGNQNISTGGVFDVSANSTVEIGGYTTWRGNYTGTNVGRVKITGHEPRFGGGSVPTTVWAVGDGTPGPTGGALEWYAGNIRIDSGNTLETRGQFVYSSVGATRSQVGSGLFRVGTGAVAYHNSNQEWYIGYWEQGDIEVASGGRFVFKVNGGDVNLDSPWGQFRVLSGGTLEADLPNASDYASIYDWDGDRGQFRLLGGTVKGTRGRLYLGAMETAGGGNQNISTGGVFDVSANSTVEIGGYTTWRGNYTGTNVGRVKITGHEPRFGGGGVTSVWTVTDGTTNPIAGGVEWNAGNVRVDSGNVLENRGKWVYTAGADRSLAGTGMFRLSSGGVFYHCGAGRVLFSYWDGPTLEVGNGGRIELRSSGGFNVDNFGPGAVGLRVASNGVLVANGTGAPNLIDARGRFEVRTGGTIEVRRNELDIRCDYTWVNAAAINGALAAGTWRISDTDGSGGNVSRLDLKMDNPITTIAAPATVILSGPDSIFSRYDNSTSLDSSLTTVSGKLGLHRLRRLTTAGALTVNSGAVLEFGLTNSALANAQLRVNGNSSLAGRIDLVDVGGMNAGQYVLVTNLTGSLSDNGLALGTSPAKFDVTLTVKTGANGYVRLGAANSAPKVSNDTGPSIVDSTHATLRGKVLQLGHNGSNPGENPKVYFCWGASNPGLGAGTGAWQNVTYVGDTYGAGESFLTAVLINPANQYYYRTYGTNSIGPAWATNILSFSVGSVRIAATKAVGSENGPTNGEFTVYRGAQFTSEPLTVNYAVKADSTATAGSDYQALSGSVTIPPGETQAVLAVTVVDDLAQGEPAETVNVRLLPGGYGIEPASNATVTILENVDYSYRMKITFRGYTKSSTLSDFPVLVVFSNNAALNFAYTDFKSAGGWDLRFGNAAETAWLPYEIEHWNTGGKSYVWAKVPQLAGTNTAIWAYWGSASKANREAYATNGLVWSANFMGVYHLANSPALSTADSTSGRYNGTIAGDTTTFAGRVDGAATFDGNGDYIYKDGSMFDRTAGHALTVSAWVNPGRLAGQYQDLVMNRSSGGTLNWGLYQHTSDGSVQLHGSAQNDSSYIPPLNTWTYIAATVDASANSLLYANATRVQTVTGYGYGAVAGRFQMGAFGAGTEPYLGKLDEIRISSVARSADWIWAEWMNMASNGVFNAVAVAQDSLPFVTTVFATNVTVTTADLLGEVASTGAAPARVFVHWNLVNGGQDKVLWTNALDLGWRPAGAVTQAVGSLLEDRVYYYRFRATNAYGERWAPAARTFKTVGDPTADNAGGATDIWVGRARLKGRLVEERSQVAIYWGPTDGGTVKSGWAHTNALGWQSSGATVAVDAVELTYGQRYYYRTYATNLAGEDWADTAASFVTLAPTNLALGVTAGLALRLDGAAASSITTNAAGTVTQWADSSGNGRHAGAYGGEPRQIPGGLNGRGVVRFDGVNDALWTTYNFDALAAHTIFTVARYRGTDRERVVSSASRDWAFGFSNGADERWYAGGWVRQAGSGNTAWHVHAGTITAESDPKAAFWKEGALLTNNATGSDNANFRPGALALGGYKYGNRQYSDSEVAEVLLYNRVLADYELDRVGSYLGRKWGVAANYSPYMGATRFGVTNTLAANVTHNGAQLRGRLYGESAVFTVYVYWGGANGGEDPGAWTHSARVGVCANAADVALARDVGQLVAGVTNYYTYRGSNAAGSVWAAAKGFFVPMLPRELRVVSAHGTAVPAVGVHSIAYGASVGCRVSAVDTQGTTQYVCTGWTMTGGQAPASGVTTNFTMTHTNHAVLTWQWGAKYWLDLTAGPHGSVNPPDQWVASGGTVQVRATPVPLYKLSEWTGDIGAIAGGGIYSTNITVTVNAPVSLTANFTESRAGALFLIR